MFIENLHFILFSFVHQIVDFLYHLTPFEVVIYFWPFIFFDFTRYVLMDLLLLFVYMPRRILARPARNKAQKKLHAELPLVSVLVPGKNEGRHIAQLAASLKRQTYKNLELVIVDDGSDDDTEQICRRLEAEGKIDRFIRNTVRGGKASAANTALYFAQGKYIVHIDADSHLAADSIETILLPFYQYENIGAVGGDVRVANVTQSLATRMQCIEYMKTISTGRTLTSMLGILRIISGAHGAFRSDILHRLKGWDVGPGMDGDITLKIRKLGFRVIHEPRAICFTNTPVKFSKLAKQRYRWDRSMVRFRLRKHLDILLPSKSFNVFNFVASFDNVFFNLILNFKWWIYIFQLMFITSPDADTIIAIFAINYFLYFISNIIEFIIVCLIYGNTARAMDIAQCLYLPLVPPYTGIFLRVVRTYAYLMELFYKVSYHDKWNPWKVSSAAKKEGL